MKRYRILGWDFDTRVHSLTMEINDQWAEDIQEQHRQNKEHIERGLMDYFGPLAFEIKRENYVALGSKPISILAFHNRFFEQVRVAFVMGAYYPALTAACALGERILNYLVLTLRDDYKTTLQYKSVYKKDSFDNWDVPIEALEAWGVLLPAAVNGFRSLREKRNKAIHFRPEVDGNDRELALEAIHCLGSIIETQFLAFGQAPWFIADIPGEMYIKKEWEKNPFVRQVYLPNCLSVGPKHFIEEILPRIVVNDGFEYEEREVTDEEFRDLRIAGQQAGFHEQTQNAQENV